MNMTHFESSLPYALSNGYLDGYYVHPEFRASAVPGRDGEHSRSERKTARQ